MANNTRVSAHHSLNGDELRTIIQERVNQGILQSMNLRAMYSFPLVRYKVTIEVIPYRPQGLNEPIQDDKNAQKCIVEGQEFIEVLEDAVELVHDSPIIGYDSDPQKEREEVGLGRVETRRIEGQFIDTHVGRKIEIEEPELPPVRGRNLAQGPIKPPIAEPVREEATPVRAGRGGTAAAQPILKGPTVPVQPVNTEGVSPELAAKIAVQEAETWAGPKPDDAIQNAIANEQPLPGRVTVLKK
jgi:hypothetical protein